jgi:hypothetical protein
MERLPARLITLVNAVAALVLIAAWVAAIAIAVSSTRMSAPERLVADTEAASPMR